MSHADPAPTNGAQTSPSPPNGAANGTLRAAHDLDALLADPATRQKIAGIVERLDVLQLGLDAADGVLRNGENLTDNVARDWHDARTSIDSGTVLALAKLVALTPKLVAGLERLAPALESEALSKLGDPKLVEALAKLSEQTPLLTFAAEAAAGFLERAEEIVDNVSEGVGEIRGLAAGGSATALTMLSQLGKTLPVVQLLLEQLQPMLDSGSLEVLVNSKILAPEMIDTVARVGDALHATRVKTAQEPVSIGVFGLLGALRDPDAKRGLGFLVTFLKEFGRQMR